MPKKMKVFTLKNYCDRGMKEMFEAEGFEVTHSLTDKRDIALLLFTGGSDVTPFLYGKEAHPLTRFSIHRDKQEIALMRMFSTDFPKVGICRGGQFLNVMSGGAMWQHVDNHAISGTHPIICVDTGEVVPATSTHHQMMVPGSDAICMAYASESSRYEGELNEIVAIENNQGEDTEVLFYHNTNSLCFQPHPEYTSEGSALRKSFFRMLRETVLSSEVVVN